MDGPLPALDGFAMPAEWMPHARCWLAWPARTELWRELHPLACQAYAGVARAIAAYEPVAMIVPPGIEAEARLLLGKNVEVVPLPIDDSWTRDSGPTFVTDADGAVAAVAWRFNAWGNRYHPYDRDAALARTIADRLGMRCYDGPLVLEGGAVHVDGAGTVLATEESILNDNRNPTLSREQVEERLALHLGARRMVWLESGLMYDETDGHIDNCARFVAPGVVMVAMPEREDDPSFARLVANRDRLAQATDAAGRTLEIIELPHPSPALGQHGPLSRSYVNFYIANGAVIVPRFDDSADDAAATIIGRVFPDRVVVQIDASIIVEGGGGLHCITQQQPEGPITPVR
ncbi:MAG: agmatine deiminase family protein [Alphaproteobacteria bacterium]